MTASPFDYVRALSETKDTSVFEDFQAAGREQDYPSFMINRSLSYHLDTVLIVNAMNVSGTPIPAAQHWAYLLNNIKPRKRYAKWVKRADTSADVKAVIEYYGCGTAEAKDIVKNLSPDELDEIKTRLDKGGR